MTKYKRSLTKKRKSTIRRQMIKKIKNKKTCNNRKHKKGGATMYGTGYGANCNDPNLSIFNTNLLKLFPYRP